MIVLEWPWTLHAYVTITIPVSKVQSFPNGIKRVGEELGKPINTKPTAHVYCSLLKEFNSSMDLCKEAPNRQYVR
jgi:hypothetical protein